MLVFFDENLVFFAVPKTGTTAYEAALRKRADIVYRGKPALKHINTRKFDRRIAPYLKAAHSLEPERMALMRDPLDQLRSWYRYRTLLPEHSPNSTRRRSFDEFVQAHLAESPPPFAKVGRQHTFLTDKAGRVRVDHLFAVDRPDAVLGFLEARFGTRFEISRCNLSPTVAAPLDPGLERAYRAARAEDFDLYAKLSESGYLYTDLAANADRRRK